MIIDAQTIQYWLESCNDLLQEVSTDGRFLYVNRAWRETLGYSDEEIARLSLFDVIHPDSRVHCEATFHDIIASQRAERVEALFVAKNGKGIEVEGSCHCRVREGEPISIQGIFRDVSERRRLEEQLRQSQKMEALGLLAGGVAHDFSNMLASILGTIEWMGNQPKAAKRSSVGLAQIHESAESALAITRQLQTFSRGGSGKTIVVDLNTIVTKTLRILGRMLDGRIRIETRLAAEPSRVRIGEGHIEQIVMNLALNARDAMPGGGTLFVEIANEESGAGSDALSLRSTRKSWVILTVRDTGCGMDQNTQRRVFEPFFTTKPEGQGSGLGLATVFGIVRQAGGTISVDSEPNRGTTFVTRFPAAP